MLTLGFKADGSAFVEMNLKAVRRFLSDSARCPVTAIAPSSAELVID